MKRLSLLFVGLSVLFSFACSNSTDDKAQKAFVAAAAKGPVMVNISTPTGKTVYSVDAKTNRIQTAVTTNEADSITERRSYSYNENLGSRSIEIEHPYTRKVTIYYESPVATANPSRGSEVENPVPVKTVRSVKVTEGDSSRGIAEKEEESSYEYYLCEDGSLDGILKRDSYGNVWVKSEFD